MSRPSLVLLGAGRVASHLGPALKAAGYDIRQVFSRTGESARRLAGILDTAWTAEPDEVAAADCYLFSVADRAIAPLAARVAQRFPQACFVHTSGSTPLSVFASLGVAGYGVLYPLQTFSRDRVLDFRTIPLFVEGSSPDVCSSLLALASDLSDRVLPLSSDKRFTLHLAAVFACNFVNHCYHVASDLLAAGNLPFDLLLPLVQETAAKVRSLPPAEAQTGPAVRMDTGIISRHLDCLKDEPLSHALYEIMSRSIHDRMQRYRINKEKEHDTL